MTEHATVTNVTAQRVEAELTEVPGRWQATARQMVRENPRYGIQEFAAYTSFQPGWTLYDYETTWRISALLRGEEPPPRTVTPATTPRACSTAFPVADRGHGTPAGSRWAGVSLYDLCVIALVVLAAGAGALVLWVVR